MFGFPMGGWAGVEMLQAKMHTSCGCRISTAEQAAKRRTQSVCSSVQLEAKFERLNDRRLFGSQHSADWTASAAFMFSVSSIGTIVEFGQLSEFGLSLLGLGENTPIRHRLAVILQLLLPLLPSGRHSGFERLFVSGGRTYVIEVKSRSRVR